MSDRDSLNALGKFLMENVRDPAIAEFDFLVKSHWSAPNVQRLQRDLAVLTTSQLDVARRAVIRAIDRGLNDFLAKLQEQADFDGDVELRVHAQNAAKLSANLQNELTDDQGWYAKFSKYGPPPEEQ